MGMTIEERIAQLVRVKHYASPRHYETLDVAIETMRKYQQIEEIYKYWCYSTYSNATDAMNKLGGVLKGGNNDN